MTKNTRKPTCWHCLAGEMLKQLLQPVGIEVQMEVQVMAWPPRADLLLIRRQRNDWTDQQRMLLADGLRDLVADHILAEMKLRGGLTEDGLKQIVVYDHLQLIHDKNLPQERLQSVIISAQTPQGDLLARFGFKPTALPGVYRCEDSPWCGTILVILLNELANTPQNAPLKCFASRQRERQKAFETIKQSGLFKLSSGFGRIVAGLWRLLMKEAMDSPALEGITPDHVMALGKEWFEFMVESTPDEELFRLPKVKQHYQEGEARGIIKGEARGVIKGEAKVLLLLLHERFGPALPDWVSAKLNTADEEALNRWTIRILKANTLEEVFQH
jgi:hypothetical protein